MAAHEWLSDTEALMWSIECDPVLRATFLSVSFLDRPPDFARFRRRMGHAAARIPRLRQRIDGRQWVEDPDFDLDYHVRHIALPPPATKPCCAPRIRTGRRWCWSARGAPSPSPVPAC